MWPFSSLIRNAPAPELEERSVLDLDALLTGTPSYSGVTVTEASAVNLPAVYRCVSINAETISSLPIDVYAKRGDVRVPYAEPVWLRNPNPFQTQAQFIAMTQTSLDLDGNAYWMKTTDSSGRLAGLSVLAPGAVTPEVVNGEVVYWVTTQTGRNVYAQNEVVHLRGLTMPGDLCGLSPIKCAQQTIGISLAAEQFGAQFFGNGATLSGVIESPGMMTREQAERIKEAFARRHGGISRSHAIGVLSGGAAWKPLSVAPEEAQFLQSRRYGAVEIANLFGVPPELISDFDGAKGYVSALHQRLRLWYITGLLPRITRIEDALTGLLPRPAYVRLNVDGLLRMDPEQRVAFYAAAQLGEWMTRNEIRALEELDPVPGGDEMLHSVQWQENQPEPEPAEESEPIVINNNMPAIKVDAPTTIQRGALQVDSPVNVHTEKDARSYAAPEKTKRKKRVVYDEAGHVVGIEEVETNALEQETAAT